MKMLLKSLRQTHIRRPPEYAHVPRFDYILGSLTGSVLNWLGIRAIKRGDTHEVHHTLAALKAGNSMHHGEPCPFGFDEMPLPREGDTFTLQYEVSED